MKDCEASQINPSYVEEEPANSAEAPSTDWDNLIQTDQPLASTQPLAPNQAPDSWQPSTLASEQLTNFEQESRKFFSGNAIFSDIDGTITDNSGQISASAIAAIKDFTAQGGQFIPVTGRARFESVQSIVEALDLPLVVINNGAEIFNRQGERIFGSELTDHEVQTAFDLADKYQLTWMQNKHNPATNEEYLYSNFTEESEQAMLAVGIVDTVHNEESRIGLSAKAATAEEVMSISGQNYKIQMMSPDPQAINAAYQELCERGIPCILNMQSPQTGEYHWVEVIRGTKTSGIQTVIDEFLPENVDTVVTMGDGGNDIPMLTAQFHNRAGDLVPNRSIAVGNASEKVKAVTSRTLRSDYDKIRGTLSDDRRFGVASEIVIRALKINLLRRAKAKSLNYQADAVSTKTVA